MTEHLLASKLADRWGISPQAVGLRAKEPGFPCDKSGKRPTYPWPEVNDWWYARGVANATARAAPLDLDEARARKMAAEAELAEIEVAKARGELVEVERFRAALLDAFGRVRSRLRDFPARAASMLAGKKTPATMRPVLEKLTEEVLGELRNEAVPDDTEVAA